MVFSSLVFIFIFLPLILAIYYFANKAYRNYILLIFSLFFYTWGEPFFVFIMIFSIIINFILARLIGPISVLNHNRKLFLIIAIIFNLLLLSVFKYLNFLIINFNNLFALQLDPLHLILPIGISFYTFQALSYIIDVYRGRVEANNSLSQVALYISFFPQLIAGPIVRYKDIYQQINDRQENWLMFNEGVKLFIYGLSMKVIIANFSGQLADTIFNLNLASLSSGTAWFGALAYSIQIFFDFAGYSTMAIGLGKMFGFTFLENFNYPYIAKSIKDFWQRWHISLSTWFKDYLYIPLGGNRKGSLRTILNQFIVFILVGLWHGASWIFVIWGLYNGALLSLEKINIIKKLQSKLPFFLTIPITFALVIIGMAIFRSADINMAYNYLKAMFGFGGETNYFFSRLNYLIISLGLIFSIPWYSYFKINKNTLVYKFLVFLFLSGLFIIDIIILTSSTYNPFIYFRF